MRDILIGNIHPVTVEHLEGPGWNTQLKSWPYPWIMAMEGLKQMFPPDTRLIFCLISS